MGLKNRRKPPLGAPRGFPIVQEDPGASRRCEGMHALRVRALAPRPSDVSPETLVQTYAHQSDLGSRPVSPQ